MNSNLPPIRKTGPGPIAPRPKNIKIQAGKGNFSCFYFITSMCLLTCNA